MSGQTVLVLALVLLAGVGVALQALLLGGFRIRQGVLHSTRISFVGTLAGAAVLLAVQAPTPAQRIVFALAAAVCILVLFVLLRGAPAFFVITGFFGLAYLLATGAGVSALGVGTTVALIVGGQMIASLALDSLGLLGVMRRELTRDRAVGAALLVAGVVLIRLT